MSGFLDILIFRCDIYQGGCSTTACLENHEKTHSPADQLLQEHTSKHTEKQQSTNIIMSRSQHWEMRAKHNTCLKVRKYTECAVCKKTVNRNNVYRHMKIHGAKQYKCVVCEKMFHHRQALNGHIQTHVEDKSGFTCSVCGQIFWGRNGFTHHKCELRLKDDRKKCHLCGKLLKKTYMKCHMRQQHEGKTFWCNKCENVYTGSNRRHQCCDNNKVRKSVDLPCMTGNALKVAPPVLSLVRNALKVAPPVLSLVRNALKVAPPVLGIVRNALKVGPPVLGLVGNALKVAPPVLGLVGNAQEEQTSKPYKCAEEEGETNDELVEDTMGKTDRVDSNELEGKGASQSEAGVLNDGVRLEF